MTAVTAAATAAGTHAPGGDPLRARVVTLTPSPAIDRVYMIDAMRTETVNRARHVRSFLAGKGVNVARNLRNAGARTAAVTTLSETDRHLAVEAGLYRIVAANQPARVNTVVIADDGATTNFNEAPRPLSHAEWARLGDETIAALRELDADWLVVAGSIPRRAEDGAALSPASLIARARALGARITLDSGGAAIAEWLDAGYSPDLVKPNVLELADATGRELVTVGDAVDAARDLVARGARAVLASLGAAGAVLVTQHDVAWADSPRVEVVNTTGAGDAALAGFLADSRRDGTGSSPVRALRRAVAWGAQTVSTVDAVATTFPIPNGVRVGTPPLDLRLDAH
ncbi:1-phosphofructokinase family hexose kinase [Gulosibacter faecalis]|uniref:1-phosphofructokinase family hexose kinase n=1 Tax=Gulosibacter faecalis TaxID=272240 RepID=A0ABW5UYQ7_9MICO|nr:hexose kinase [Gulosibacter faecalis]